jgi:thiamine-phosphate pyrophosphorylase
MLSIPGWGKPYPIDFSGYANTPRMTELVTNLPAQRVRGLYAITPSHRDTAELLAQVRAALQGGAAVLQYRDKSADTSRRLHAAQCLQQLCRDHGAWFVVNDDLELARAVQADAVHVGRNDKRPENDAMAFGVSCYNDFHLAETSAAQGAAYIAFGAVFPSSTKPAAVPAPLSLFQQAASLKLPRVAIGGITLATAPALITAGADALAVIADLFQADDIAEQAHRYQQLFSGLTL